MGRHSRHYIDLNPLEGGGSGGGSGGYSSTKNFKYRLGLAGALGAGVYTAGKKQEAKKHEAKSKEDSMTAGQKQSMQEAKDEEDYQKRKTAPTTKTEMGNAFAKGGMTASSRADGCAQRGKTRGTLIT
jgi:hypothetical protein